MEEKSLTEYGASYHAWDEKEKVVRGLLAVMDALYEKGILENNLSPDNITIMPDLSVRMAGVESVGDCAAEALDGKDATKGFYNTDKNPKQTIWSKDLFGLAMSILYLYMGTGICFFSDESSGEDTRPVIDKVMEQMVLAVEEKKLPKEIRNVVYSLLLKSSQRIEEKPVFSTMLDRELPFPATKRWEISLEQTDEVCCSFLKGLYREAETNLKSGSERLWDSTDSGRSTNTLNIQHGAAGIAEVLLELEKVEGFEDISHEILELVEEYLCTVDVFRTQEDNSLLFGNHGIAWFLYDFYKQRKDTEKTKAAVRFALSLSGESKVQDYAEGLAGYGCTYLKFWNETGNTAFLEKAEAAADSIYAHFAGRNSKQGKRLKEVSGLGFAHGEAGLFYFMYLMYVVTDRAEYHDYVNECLPAYLKRVEGEVNGYYREKKKTDLSWCNGLVGIGTALLVIGQHEWKAEIYPVLRKISGILTDSMWQQSGSQCYGNAGSVEFLMDTFYVTRDSTFLYQAKTIAHYIYTQRFYDSQGNVQFTDETGQSTCYDYGTGAVGTMRAILFADGYVYDRLYMPGDLRKRKL